MTRADFNEHVGDISLTEHEMTYYTAAAEGDAPHLLLARIRVLERTIALLTSQVMFDDDRETAKLKDL